VANRIENDDPTIALSKTMRALLLSALSGVKQRQQIELLDRSGFGQSEIADIVGSTPKAVSVRLAEIRRETQKRRKGVRKTT
jgi:DNA-directed RNA polymerase specialized sigma24 family protein